jgi:hypothetical protein
METVIFTIDANGTAHFYGQYPDQTCDAINRALDRLENDDRKHGICPTPIWLVFAAQQAGVSGFFADHTRHGN